MKRLLALLLLFLTGLLITLGSTSSIFNLTKADTVDAPNGIVFPKDAGVFNVRDYGAKGDGISDDSAAIQAALDKAQNTASIVYLPDGEYLVTGPLHFYRWIMIQGQSRQKTVIKLKNQATKYSNPKTPNWVLFASPKDANLEGSGDNMAFCQYVMDLTIDTGTGNPGAIGMMFISNNGGGLRNVTIRSGDGQGPIGLDLRKPWDGPALYKNVFIEGFDFGIHVRHLTYSSDFENLTLTGQRVAGIINESHPLTFRKLTSSLAVPVIKNEGDGGLVIVLDSSITGIGNPAIAIQNNRGGAVFLRNASIKGYASDMSGPRHTYTTAVSTVVSSHPLDSLFSDRAIFRDKNIPDTPSLPWESFSNWVSVAEYKHLVNNGDWTPAIQAAIDSGKTTVYFPRGEYRAASTISVRGNVRVLQGLSSGLVAAWGGFGEKPLLRIESGKQDTVFIDSLIMAADAAKIPVISIEHASSSNLVVTRSRGMSYRNVNTKLGDLFVDDMAGNSFYFTYPQKAWFRQLNIEGNTTKVINYRGDIWIQGFKSEGLSTLVENTSPEAKTVVMGGLDYPVSNDDRNKLPSFSNQGGSMTVVIANFWTNLELVREQVNGVVRSYKKPLGERFTFYASTNPAHANASQSYP